MKRSRWIAASTGTVAAAGVLLFVLFHAPASHAAAEGSFANDCCGELQLRDGQMLLNHRQTVAYVEGRDRVGPYILPKTYVGALEDEGFEVDGTRPSAKLRLDRLPGASTIVIHEGPHPYVFKRQPAKGPVRS